jgi:uncharacterized protein YukE
MTVKKIFINTLLLLTLVFAVFGCSRLYYSAMEQVGVHKRDIMVERVQSARDAQEDAKTQFRDALEAFKSVVNVPGGDLEKKYERLNATLKKTEAEATEVRNRIDAVENVSRALFREWRREIAQYQNQAFKRSSREKYKQTQKKYRTLMLAMNKAESRLEPALRPLRDQVMFMKHNLNARAIAGLSGELEAVEIQVERLIMEMEEAIESANVFISDLLDVQGES